VFRIIVRQRLPADDGRGTNEQQRSFRWRILPILRLKSGDVLLPAGRVVGLLRSAGFLLRDGRRGPDQ